MTYLHLNVQDTGAVLLSDVADGLDAGAVVVAAELCVLDETALINELQEVLFGDEVVFAAVLFAASGRACCVFLRNHQSSWPVRVKWCPEVFVREMEKPKRSGNSLRRRFRWVDFPEPEGPEMTIGRLTFSERFMSVRCILGSPIK